MQSKSAQRQRDEASKIQLQRMTTNRTTPAAAAAAASASASGPPAASSSADSGPSPVAVDLSQSGRNEPYSDSDSDSDGDGVGGGDGDGDEWSRLNSPAAPWLSLPSTWRSRDQRATSVCWLVVVVLLLVVGGAAYWCQDQADAVPEARRVRVPYTYTNASPLPPTPDPADPSAAAEPLPQSDAVSALRLYQQSERVGCGWGHALSVVDCRSVAGGAVGGYDWRSGRVQGEGASCAEATRGACDGQRVCTLSQTDAWLTYRCVNASLPLPEHPPLATLAVDTPVAVASPLGRTIVVYVFAPSDPLYLDNLRYFVAQAMRPEQTVDYVVITNLDDGQEVDLPPLPPNARYVLHRNECFDWGSMGWLVRLQWELDEGDPRRIDFSRYSWFVMANPSVRGPMLPAWQNQAAADFRQWWIYPFQHKLLRSPDVRAAGCTASLAIAAHIQSYVWLTDRIGWELLQSERSVTGCYQQVWPETVLKSEVGASQLFIRHNYNFAVLMRALADADFRRPQDFNDGFQHDPSISGVVDYHYQLPMPPLEKDRKRLQLEPLEVVFVKHKHDTPVDRLRALIRYGAPIP